MKIKADGNSVGYCYRIKGNEDLKRMIKMAKEANLNGLHVEYSDYINAEFVKEIHDNDLLCVVWNKKQDDTPHTANKLLIAGVDLINTNQPEVLFTKCRLPIIMHESGEAPYKMDQDTMTGMLLR